MRYLLIAAALLTATAGVHAHSLMSANVEVPVARSSLHITPDRDWNKLSQRPGRNSETWTLDGELLNDMSFYGGIESDRTLFREVDRRNRPLPRFNSTMLPTDIPTLLENSYRIARSASIFTIDSQEPVQFAGASGIRFTYTFVQADELVRKGEANAAIIDGKLYMASFEAPAIHYFESSIASYRRMVGTARMQAAGRRRR